MVQAPTIAPDPECPVLNAQSLEREAVDRIRLAAALSLIPEIILPVVEAAFFTAPDWRAIEIQMIWLGCTLALWAATWHPRFSAVWKPTALLFAAALIVTAGILSLKGANLAPFMFLLVLLPVGGICLPWDNHWECAMCALCVVSGLGFSSQFNWQDRLVISGLSAVLVSILGAYVVSLMLTRQRSDLHLYVEALARSETKFRRIFESSGSLIAVCSIPHGRLLDVNQAWQTTFGYNHAEAVGKTLAELGLTSADDRLIRRWDSLRSGEAGIEQNPKIFRARSAEAVYCAYSWSTLMLNNCLCVLLVGQDVTKHMRAEEELRRNREALLNQERLRAVGELASGIAHDLNNSLNALRLRVEILKADPNVSSHQDSLSLMSRIIGDAGATIAKLQDTARRNRRPAESLDLGAIIRESVEMARSTLEGRNSPEHGVSVEVNLPQLPVIIAESVELRQIFLNLLLNARDAMRAGGTIHIGGRVDAHAVEITLEDEGDGIPPQYLTRIFDPFFTTKGEGGTGLGLAMAYGTMTNLGGGIIAANRDAGGAVFTLTFPITPKQRAACG